MTKIYKSIRYKTLNFLTLKNTEMVNSNETSELEEIQLHNTINPNPTRIILFPVDDSPYTKNCIHHYLSNMRKEGDRLILLNVRPSTDTSPFHIKYMQLIGYDHDIHQRMKSLHRDLSVHLLKLIAKPLLDENLDVRAFAGLGDLKQDLLNFIKTLNPHLILIGCRGLSSIQKTFKLSVSDFLVQHCSIPIEVIPLNSKRVVTLPVYRVHCFELFARITKTRIIFGLNYSENLMKVSVSSTLSTGRVALPTSTVFPTTVLFTLTGLNLGFKLQELRSGVEIEKSDQVLKNHWMVQYSPQRSIISNPSPVDDIEPLVYEDFCNPDAVPKVVVLDHDDTRLTQFLDPNCFNQPQSRGHA
ncbi:hypothetical protein BC833DRAFT_659716 [Globomyces pollinis-pini]|nr:hypothetical protein BC833DRAFT_659716 [Globomyces pollinis-pini]